MERLQAAIEKARAQREETRPDTPPPPAFAAQGAQAYADADGTEAAWAALRPLDTTRPAYSRKSSLVAFQPGGVGGAYDILRTRLVQQAETNGWRRIAIVSAGAAAGKTTTAANLAFSLSRQSDYRSLVIDFDLRRVSLAKALDQEVPHTMEDVIEGRVPFSEHALRYGTNVAFALNGKPVPQSAELLQSQRAKNAMAEIEATYKPDFILFDVPPLFTGDDSIGFLRNVDCALIVVAAEETPMAQIDIAERQVAELTRVMGVVLNKCRMTSDDYSYDYSGY
ncbi:chromosome partitioning protein [Haematobacter missouriensis]|uniref:Chromosome partitioning protein n=1 Tax=Haematobacter missouriensis TaxID=366616 RepID=A0A212AR83_9RHOB|nr:CpsD/CapB family tyrosine-protein kinase [Haematobacter missouriensis]OWJ84027.1 chromosome partitioning protein [Haematobacter missouriensis]